MARLFSRNQGNEFANRAKAFEMNLILKSQVNILQSREFFLSSHFARFVAFRMHCPGSERTKNKHFILIAYKVERDDCYDYNSEKIHIWNSLILYSWREVFIPGKLNGFEEISLKIKLGRKNCIQYCMKHVEVDRCWNSFVISSEQHTNTNTHKWTEVG